jgi:hypothetical protein
MGGPRWRWFSLLLEDEEREGLTWNYKGKIGDFSPIDPNKMKRTLEEEDMQVLTW